MYHKIVVHVLTIKHIKSLKQTKQNRYVKMRLGWINIQYLCTVEAYR
jgi:hypothetical protein